MGVSTTLQEAINASIGAADPDSAGKLVILAEIDRFDVVSKSKVLFRAATSEYASKPTDSEANKPYKAVLVLPETRQSILADGDFAHSASVDVSEIHLLNIDGDLDDAFDHDQYNWRGTRVVLLAGLADDARSDFEIIPGGQLRIVDVLPGERVITLKTVPLHNRPDGPIQSTRYGGFGRAYEFGGTADVNCGDVYDLGERDASLQIRFKTSGSGSLEILMMKRASTATSAGNAGWMLAKNASDGLVCVLDDGSNSTGAIGIGSAGEYTDGEWHTLTVVINRTSDELNAWVDTTQEVAASDISAVTGSLSNASNLRQGADSSGSTNWSGQLDEPRVWHRVLTEEDVFATNGFSVDGVEDGLVGAWRWDETSGTAFANEVPGPMKVQAHLGGAAHLDMGSIADPGSGSCVVAAWARISSAGTVQVVAGRKSSQANGNAGYVMRINASGQAIFNVSDGSATATVTIDGPFDDDTTYGLALVVDRDLDELRGYVLDYPRGTLTAGTAQDISSVGSLTNATTFRAYAYGGGANNLTGAVSWIFYAPSLPTATEVEILLSEQVVEVDADAPTVPPAIDRLTDGVTAHWWPVNENTGSTATDQLGSSDGTFSSAPSWRDRDGVLTPGASGARAATYEGEIEQKGIPKPVAFGAPRRIMPILIDKHFLHYQYSDPALGTTQEIETVYAGAVALTGGGTDYSEDLTNNVITLTAAQQEELTMDVKGVKDPDASDRWLRFPGEIVSFAWRKMLGLPDGQVDTATITTYDDDHPFQVSVYLGPCEITVEQFHCYILQPDGYAYRSSENKLALATRSDPASGTSALSLSDKDIAAIRPLKVPPISSMVRIGYDRTWHDLSSFQSGVDASDQRTAQQPWRYVQANRDSITTTYDDAIARTYLTSYRKRRDCQILASRMIDLDSEARRGWEIVLSANHWAAAIADIIDVASHSRYDLAGDQFLVVGHSFRMAQGMPRTSLFVWG